MFRSGGKHEPFTDAEQRASFPGALPPPKKDGTFSRLRKSITEYNVTNKVKQVIGRKRSRDECEDDTAREQPVRKAPITATAFWKKYRELRVYHNDLEAMANATAVAHAYDEENGLVMRHPPTVNEEALAALEGRSRSRVVSTATSWSWSGSRLEEIYNFCGLPPSGPLTPAPLFSPAPLFADYDFMWAGEEVYDFRNFVVSAERADWDTLMDGVTCNNGDDMVC